MAWWDLKWETLLRPLLLFRLSHPFLQLLKIQLSKQSPAFSFRRDIV
ncbi:hypothetical protein BVRB_6g131600 [Beta vulgaris subsp. vulgaris]|nr:hypothetical protein BVRB_6g131600 [Beta vulgaris subsp. vulgaris]